MLPSYYPTLLPPNPIQTYTVTNLYYPTLILSYTDTILYYTILLWYYPTLILSYTDSILRSSSPTKVQFDQAKIILRGGSKFDSRQNSIECQLWMHLPTLFILILRDVE